MNLGTDDEDDSLYNGGHDDDDDDDDDEEPWVLPVGKTLVPKISGRKNNTAQAKFYHHGRYAGLAEVMKAKGKLLQTTGITLHGRVFLHVEEIGYLLQREALQVLDGSAIMSIVDLYKLIMIGDCGCSWDAYKVYLELKVLGYVVSRHGVPWSTSSSRPGGLKEPSSSGLHGCFESLHIRDGEGEVDDGCKILPEHVEHICKLDVSGSTTTSNLCLTFDVYAPNSKFKKTDPGTPEFSLCISSEHPPELADHEMLCSQNGGIPIKIASVDCGRAVGYTCFCSMQAEGYNSKHFTIVFFLFKHVECFEKASRPQFWRAT